MARERDTELEKIELEDGEMKTNTDEDIEAEEEEEEDEDEEEEDEAGVAVGTAQRKAEEQSDRDGEADSEEKLKTKKKKKKKKKKLQQQKQQLQQQQQKRKTISKAGNKIKETEIASEREVLKGSPRRKMVKEEPRDGEENEGLEEDNGKLDDNGKRDGKGKVADGRDRLVVRKSPAQPQSLDEPFDQKSETEDDEEEKEDAERGEDANEDEKSEEEERKEAEKDLALTMSSSWAPLSERERESLKVSKSGREERESETYREVQSESLKDRVRAREDDTELSKEKSKLKKQKLSEPPLLSLSLPDTSLHLASSDACGQVTKSKSKCSGPVPKSSENERSFRSFGPTPSQSNGYTNSLSLSLSHQFFHNPSCSLTQNSFDDKDGTTCSSRQISLLRDDPTEGSRGSSFGGREPFFHTGSEGSPDRIKQRRELPLYQKLLQSGSTHVIQGALGNGEGTRDSSRSFMDERPMEPLENPIRRNECSQGGHFQGGEQLRWKDEASLASGCNERSRTSHRPWSIHKDTRDKHRQECWSSPSQSGSFQDRLYDQRKLSGRERRPDADAGRELSLSGSRGFAEREEESAGHEKGIMVVEEDSAKVNNSRKIERSWLHDIVTESIPRMAQKLQDVPGSFLENLKKCLQDTLGSSKRKDEFGSLQRTLQRRSDLTAESLSQSHRTQLEILVALKTGIPAFLHSDIALTTSALTEIFLGTKCRNVACQSQLPADDCECKVCSSKPGFCNACMCVVCSKFDFDANTCRWIGCDFCLHWCHSDCGIHMGHISSGISSRATSGDSVMQFRCIGCDHTSELYGFVKDVFTTCAKDWPLDVLARELHCVRRIFHRSEDLRGKQLFGRAEQLLAKLDSSRDVEAVCQSMMKFFAAGEKEIPAPRAISGADEIRDAIPLPQEREMTSRLADAVRGAIHVIRAPNGDGSDLERARAALEFFDHEVEEKRHEASELQHERAWQKAQIEELENIVQIKQAEAKVLQMRADEVRREAEGLQRIVQAKTEKIEEEYEHKLIKLRLSEAEERRRKWSEEVQNMEKAHREYSAVKMSMVSDIRELLKTVEAAKAQLS
ncbi:unnamed protein product [Calypogeia fissa]